jgi:prepilin-type processing-associated H-X9-DG protein
VVIAIIAILAAILFPVFAKARSRALQTQCISNCQQLGRSILLYADDNEDRTPRSWWDWHRPLEPYVKSGEVFACPASRNKRVTRRTFAAGTFPDPSSAWPAGEYWTNRTDRPWIWGNYAINKEYLQHFGDTSRAYLANNPPMTSWKTPSQVILIAECQDYKTANPTGDVNGPYIEHGGTTWREIWAQLSTRHGGGPVCVFADGHSAWKRAEWFQTQEGKHAICPAKEFLGPTTGF